MGAFAQDTRDNSRKCETINEMHSTVAYFRGMNLLSRKCQNVVARSYNAMSASFKRATTMKQKGTRTREPPLKSKHGLNGMLDPSLRDGGRRCSARRTIGRIERQEGKRKTKALISDNN